MRDKKSFMYPSLERIFQLDDLDVPPVNYADFLTQVVEVFHHLIMEEYDAKDTYEVSEKIFEKVKSVNPDKSDKELEQFSYLFNPVDLGFNAQLKFLKPEKSDRVPNKVYSSREHKEDFFYPYLDGRHISFEDYQEQIPKLVEELQRELRKRYNSSRIPDGLFGERSEKESDIYKSLSGFDFTLHMKSMFTQLDVDVALINYGAISQGGKLKESVFIPAISTKARMTFGSLDLPENIVKRVGEIVENQYKVNAVEYRESYVKEHEHE